jgi:hypothetical protein
LFPWTTPNKANDEAFHMVFEYLEASGIPPARLTLKIGALVMLIRGMNPVMAFANSARCIVKRMHSRVLNRRRFGCLLMLTGAY